MKPCIGCKHLIAQLSLCKATDVGPWAEETNPLSGRVKWVNLHPDVEWSGWRPSVEHMRKSGASCGPDAKLYEPTLWHRLMLMIWP